MTEIKTDPLLFCFIHLSMRKSNSETENLSEALMVAVRAANSNKVQNIKKKTYWKYD